MKCAPFAALASINLFNSTNTQSHLVDDLTRCAIEGRAVDAFSSASRRQFRPDAPVYVHQDQQQENI